ncbi:hypothetical protein GCM10009801_48120 [Streptomyces albiaxialis]|uniref:Ferric siderophore reductase C-terminal domain-containing protein n=1 Tax=Streptomyces albiaxialis TaxID=329523 RepID=A0ABN2W7Z4_9ACTN
MTPLDELFLDHGPRYDLAVGTPDPGDGGWLPCDRLLDPSGAELGVLLDAETGSSGHRTAHAAALTLIAVYAGRVTAAAVLDWALHGRVWDVRPENVLVRPAAHGIGGVRLREARTLDPSLTALHSAVLHTHLLPLADALHARTRAGLRQLRGGVAHGCATALCASRGAVHELAPRWAEFSAGTCLEPLGEVVEVAGHLRYLRRTCCLFYTSAESVRCASCCLTPRDERIRAYARSVLTPPPPGRR